MSRLRNVMRVMKVVAEVLCYAFLLYAVVCYIDIVAHNLSGGTDAWWNMFVIILGGK